jgi:hypothetical protein
VHLLGVEEHHGSVVAAACSGHHLRKSIATLASLFDFFPTFLCSTI